MGKTTIRASCIDQRLVVVSPPVIASGGRNEDMVEFEFCPLWAGFSKTAVFYRDAADPYHAVVTDDKCIIPWEVLQTDGFVYFGVFGVKDDITRTSEVIRYRVTAGAITEGTKPSDPTPDIYEQLLGKMSNVESLVAPSDPYSLTGKLVQLDNFEGMPMNAVTRIEPVQAGSGDPYPGGGGKNLLDMRGAAGGTSNGITAVVNADGSYHISGTATSADINIWFRGNYGLTNPLFTLQPGTYYVRNVVLFNGTNVLGGLYTGGVFTLSAATPVTGIRCVSLNAGQAFDVTVYPAIYSGNSNQEWQPYANIRPISGHTGAKLTRCGKNVLSSKLLGGNESYVSVTTDGRWRINNTSGNTIYIGNEWTNLPAGDYCFRTDSAIANMLLYIQKNQDDYSEYISDGIPMRIIHVSNGEKIRILCAVPNGTNATISVWATIGVNPKPFISYQGKTFSASFGQTVYGGTLDWNTGVLTVDRAVYNFTGNEPFSLASGGIPYFSVTKSAGVIASVARFDQTSAENGSCSHYKPVSAWSGNACEYMGVTHSFRFTDTRFAAVDDFKAYLAAQKTAGTPVQVCYKLATPTTIRLTPAQITALQGMNNICCDAGETTVSGRKDILWLTSGLLQRIQTLEATVATLEAAALSE